MSRSLGRLGLLGIAVVGVVLLGGCGVLGRGARVDVPLAGLEVDPEYGPTIDVSNFRGSVRVIADERAKTPTVSARVRRLDRSLRLRDKDLAQKATITADSGIEDGRRLLRVETAPNGEEEVAVDLVVRIATTEGIRVRNAGGPVELVGIQGPVTVINGVGGVAGGDVTVRTGEAMTDHVNLVTTDGTVLYQVGPGSSGAFYLETDSGKAEFYAKIGKVTEARPSVSTYRAVLNSGDNPISLRSGDGNVRVVVLQNAGTYGPDHWDGYPVWPKYPKPIGRLGGYHNDEPLFRKRQAPAE